MKDETLLLKGMHMKKVLKKNFQKEIQVIKCDARICTKTFPVDSSCFEEQISYLYLER